jgi:hypothetical protein
MHRKRQKARRIRHSWDGSTTIRIKISPGIAQERTTGSIYPKRTGKIEVETNKSDGFCRENCDNGNIQVKGKAVNICNLMIFLECLMQLNSLIKTSENNLKSK